MKAIALSLLLLSSTTAAMAQRGPFTPAPVPALDQIQVSPSNRAGRSDAADSAAPFAASPTGLFYDAPDRNRNVPPASGGGQTPDVSR